MEQTGMQIWFDEEQASKLRLQVMQGRKQQNEAESFLLSAVITILLGVAAVICSLIIFTDDLMYATGYTYIGSLTFHEGAVICFGVVGILSVIIGIIDIIQFVQYETDREPDGHSAAAK